MRERRAKQRRNYRPVHKFPMVDNSGCIVSFDRSRISDRRLNNLILEESGAKKVYLRGSKRLISVCGSS